MTREEIRTMIVEEIGSIAPEADAGTVADDADLREALDLDSMDVFNLVVAVSRRLGVDVPDSEAGRLVTLGGGAAYLEELLSKAGPRRPTSAPAREDGGPPGHRPAGHRS